ncbi:DUF317 domain-containing protein [Actinacidiphila sp. DG2A-62]|uniref:DUF317 domain-containing protein n=1 Tax=Actinacidiphila sp. DG2A-62 TaxID=3108821 RepID=UPI002DBF574D|nr:DUF317 domain-containing protein [Actinacidiphila sp. DG2A-62]MEC3997184.1 DUF317 domain-containing protein [Actinacidiphila sp. DG2A-62]
MTLTPGDAVPIPRRWRAVRDTSYDDVLVAPRYLAGHGGDPSDAFAPLTHHYWHDMHDELGNHYVSTGGSQLRIAFVPEVSELMPDATALWQIRAREGWPPRDVWSAALTDDTPPEIIAAITAALDAAVSNEPGRELYTDRGISHDADPAAVWEIFREAHWRVTAAGFLAHAESPDELVQVAYRNPRSVGRDRAWLATIADPEGNRPLWEAWLHSATPTFVLRAFATALTDPTPIPRDVDMLAPSCRPYATPLLPAPPAVQTAVPTPLELARRQPRRPSAPHARSIPRWSTSTRPASPMPTPTSASLGRIR